MTVLVTIRNGPFRDLSKATVRRWGQRMLTHLDLRKAELSIALTNDKEIQELNRVFRRRDRPTDVLAFAMREGEAFPRNTERGAPASEMLGDVVVSVETARRQAARRRRLATTEICELLAHGILHLCGYDHRTAPEARRMSAKTRELCRAAAARQSLVSP